MAGMAPLNRSEALRLFRDWGFTPDPSNSMGHLKLVHPNLRTVQVPNGSDKKAVPWAALRKGAMAVGVSIQDFLKGPPSEKKKVPAMTDRPTTDPTTDLSPEARIALTLTENLMTAFRGSRIITRPLVAPKPVTPREFEMTSTTYASRLRANFASPEDAPRYYSPANMGAKLKLTPEKVRKLCSDMLRKGHAERVGRCPDDRFRIVPKEEWPSTKTRVCLPGEAGNYLSEEYREQGVRTTIDSVLARNPSAVTPARREVLEALVTIGGVVEDDTGRATSLLAGLMGRNSGSVNHLLHDMEKDGQIVRKTNTTRTTYIGLADMELVEGNGGWHQPPTYGIGDAPTVGDARPDADPIYSPPPLDESNNLVAEGLQGLESWTTRPSDERLAVVNRMLAEVNEVAENAGIELLPSPTGFDDGPYPPESPPAPAPGTLLEVKFIDRGGRVFLEASDGRVAVVEGKLTWV